MARAVTCAEVAEYETIFNHRGDSYAAAMRKYPEARAVEIANLFLHVDRDRVRAVADVPSRSGYLTAHLPTAVTVDAYDPSLAFREAGAAVYPVDLANPLLIRRDYDLIVSLAALHHIGDKRRFFRALAEHVGPGGSIVLADVAADSKVAAFLDGFIAEHSDTGHDGLYLSPGDPFELGADHPRIADARIETLACPWRFDNRGAMVDFAKLLFGVEAADPHEAEASIVEGIGIRECGDHVEMDWELTYITARLT